MTEFRTLKEIVDDPHSSTMRDVMRNMEARPGDTITCICCGKQYKRGNWNFYNLCDPCFAQFDRQKMRGRGVAVYEFFSGNKVTVDATESAEEFVKMKRCTHMRTET